MKINIFCIFLNGFSTEFSRIILKTSTLWSAKGLSQEDSKSTNPLLQETKKNIFFTTNAIVLQSM
jgi:hypothetical protein